MELTAYQVLQVREDACAEVVTAAYRALAKKFHPDLQKELDLKPQAEILQYMQAVNWAYSELETPQKRAQYDFKLKTSWRLQPVTQQQPMQTQSAFVVFFGGNGGYNW